jgi:hypothetical protein
MSGFDELCAITVNSSAASRTNALCLDCRGMIELEAEIFDHAMRIGRFLTRSR